MKLWEIHSYIMDNMVQLKISPKDYLDTMNVEHSVRVHMVKRMEKPAFRDAMLAIILKISKQEWFPIKSRIDLLEKFTEIDSADARWRIARRAAVQLHDDERRRSAAEAGTE